MPTFDTHQPISAVIEFDVGSLRVIAGERADTVVEVQPSDPDNEQDVRVARLTMVSYEHGGLRIKGPRKRSMFGRPGSIDVRVELPAGSSLYGDSPLVNMTCQGQLGDCELKTALGGIHVEEAADTHLTTNHGDIRIDRVTGDANISGSGRIDIGEILGTARVKNLNGETVLGEVGGDLRANTSNGSISVDVAHASVVAKSAHGSVRIGQVTRGQIVLETAAGNLEVGIPAGTAAWLDLNTNLGTVHNSLESADTPSGAAETVEVRARCALGDIVIRRA